MYLSLWSVTPTAQRPLSGVKSKAPTFRELRHDEVRRIHPPHTPVNKGRKPPRIGCSDTHMGEDHPTPDSHNEDTDDEHCNEPNPEEPGEHGYLGKAYPHAGDDERDYSP